MARVEIGEVVDKAQPVLGPAGNVTARVVGAGLSVQVNVRGAAAGTVYQAATGAATFPNPLTSDSNGRVEGWLEEGSYDLVVSGSGITPYTQQFEAASGVTLAAVSSGQITALVTKEAPINPKHPQYGAVMDGVADDSAAWQAAANAVPATGGEILHPGGTSVAHSVRLKSGTKLLAIGPGAKLKLRDAAPAIGGDYPAAWVAHRVLLTNANAGSSGNTNIEIDGVELDGNHAGNSALEAYPLILFGVRNLRIPKLTFGNCGRAGLLLGASQSAFVQNSDVQFGQIVGFDVGLVGGWGAVGVVSVDRFQLDQLLVRGSADYCIDFEPNVATNELIRQVQIGKVVGFDCGSGVVVNCAGKQAADTVQVAMVELRDGPTYAVARLARFSNVNRPQLWGASSGGYVPNFEPVLLEACGDFLVAGVEAPGAYNGDAATANRGGVRVDNCTGGLVTLCDLPGGGNQQYAVLETGTSNNTVVHGNRRLGGSLGRALLVGAASFLGQNGPDEGWVAPALSGTWANQAGYNPAGYYKDATGRVHLRGGVTGGAVPSTIFTLPAGYRPLNEQRHAVMANGAFGYVTVQTTGIVQASGGAVPFSLDGLSFRTT